MRDIPIALPFGVTIGLSFGTLTVVFVQEPWIVAAMLLGASALAVLALLRSRSNVPRDEREVLQEKLVQKEESLHMCRSGLRVAEQDAELRISAAPVLHQMLPTLEAEVADLRLQIEQLTPPPTYRTAPADPL